jgi:hypothetical protein
MKNKTVKTAFFVILGLVSSCNEPETVVINIVHTDGSVTRRIEMKNIENKFELSDIQVPFDSSWTVRDSIEITEDDDTIWVKRAEKLFRTIDEINRSYLNDSGANRNFNRRVEFNKRFRWFNTEYRFAEVVAPIILQGYPVSDFLSDEELQWFYSPTEVNDRKKQGADSLKYRSLAESIDKKTEKWMLKSIASEWICEFTKLISPADKGDLAFESLKKREDEFVEIVDGEDFDSLWSAGILPALLIGENNAFKFKVHADSSIGIVLDKILNDFSDYTMKIDMPGEIIGTNGLIDSTGILSWPVKSDYFLTEEYIMWSESKVPNLWAWLITGVFLVFVGSGIIFRKIRKG